MSGETRTSRFYPYSMWAGGMAYYAWNFDHAPVLAVLLLWAGVTLGCVLLHIGLAYLWRLVRRFPYRIVRKGAGQPGGAP